MRILVVGNGAREDALSWKLAQSPQCEALFASPGNAGTAARGVNWGIAVTDAKRLVERARAEHVDLCVIGPETALAAGVADKMREAGISTFGAARSAARLESSKIFAKRFMERHEIPTAYFRVVHSLEQGEKALADWRGSVVVKADGLAAGKGVVVCNSPADARVVLRDWYGGGGVPGGGMDVVLEAKLEGVEVSVFALLDGRAGVMFGAACDYKRAGDGDTGPNTGGMGAYSPPAALPHDLLDSVRERILAPVMAGLDAEGEEYRGALYLGLMWNEEEGASVLEFNARFGDPETQVLMPRFTGDLPLLLKSCADGALDPSTISMSRLACVGVVLATREYPVRSAPVGGLPAEIALPAECAAFWGTSQVSDGRVSSPGGRVLTVTALGEDIESARRRVYGAVRGLGPVLGDKLTFRSDIASEATLR
ncbi:phosphoribosylamine--glycine ligase [bacterium]|nr:MAG: phosphoribosylamine--glycine ligase [bacterium]